MNHESIDFVETESTILEGDEVEVMADHHLCLEGFLKANRGEALQVLSVERGKILCRKTNGEAGWLRRAYVSVPQRRVGDLLLVGKMETSGELQNSGAASSFCASGDILELLTEGKDHRLWCRNLDGRCGWISLENFSKKLPESDATPWKKLVSSPPLQLPQLAHRKVETKTELMPFPSMGRKPSWQSYELVVSEGEVAEILEQRDAFTKVMMFSRNPQVIGWVPTKCLSSQPVQMQTQATQSIPQQLPHLHRGLQTIPETGDSGDSSDVRRSERLISEVHLEGRCSPVTQWTGTTREAEPAEPEPQSEPVESWIEAAEASLRTPSASQGNLDARPDAQGRVIHVSSFGLETLDRELTWQCNHLGGGARCTIPEKDVAAALRRVQGGAEAENLLILDARPFPDPNSWVLSQLGHSGRHHQIVGSLCHHRNFWYWLRDVKRRFQKELEKSGDISVAIYCKRGKHRSVAAAVILRHIFQSEGYQCSNAWHMSYKQWSFCCYLDCDVCCNPPEEMQTHLDMALDYWRKI